MQLFKDIAREVSAYEQRRDHIIKVSRDILRDAKRMIFLCHEGKLDEAGTLLDAVQKQVKKNEEQFQKPFRSSRERFALYREGSWAACVEEYLEAWFLYNFLKSKRIVAPSGIRPSADVFIGALSDFTGELTRLAVMRGAKKDTKALEQHRKASADVVASLLPLYLTGQNRQKFDQAKRNLKRIEEIIYEVNIRS